MGHLKAKILIGCLTVVCLASSSLFIGCSSKKDACSGVTCFNGGACKNGSCSCPAGLGGSQCGLDYRSVYANVYLGSGTDNEMVPRTLSSYQVTMNYNNDSNYTVMSLLAQNLNSAGVYVTHFSAPIVMDNFTSASAGFTITPTVNAQGFRISGTGTISASAISMTVTETDTTTGSNAQPTIVYTFSNLQKQ